MHPRIASVLAAGISAIAVFLVSSCFLSLPVCAQQETGSTGAGTSPALPADVEAKLDALQGKLSAAQAAGDSRAKAKALNSVGSFYSSISQYARALDFYQQALVQAHAAKDKHQEVSALNGIADCYRGQDQNDKALSIYQQVLDLATASGDFGAQAAALNGFCWINANTGKNQKALEYHIRALPLARKAEDQSLQATILRCAGVAYSNLNEQQKALDDYNQALPLYRAMGDRGGEAATLIEFGVVYRHLGEKQKAMDFLTEALPLYRAVGDRDGEARTMGNIANVYLDLGEKQKALDSFNQVLPILRAVGNRSGEAKTLGNIGGAYDNLGEPQKALDYYTQALPIFRAVGDRGDEARTLGKIGAVSNSLGENQKALDFDNQALSIFRAMGDRGDEIKVLANIGVVYSVLGEQQKALDSYNQVLTILRATGDRGNEAKVLGNMGVVYYHMGEEQKALDTNNEARQLYKAVGNPDGEAMAMTNIGLVYSVLGEQQKALDSYNLALPLFRAAGDRDNEAMALGNIGSVYDNLGEKENALGFLNQALSVFRLVGDRASEAATLSNIGAVYNDLGEQQKALDSYNRALPIHQAVGDRDGVADTLTNIGEVYFELGEKENALRFFNQALPLYRAVRDRDGEAKTLANVGAVYNDLGERHKALDSYNQALPIHQAIGDRDGEAVTLNDVGAVYLGLGEKQKALDHYNQALPIFRAVGDRGGESKTLKNIGSVYNDLGDQQKALDYCAQALPLAIAVSNPLLEADIFHDLLRNREAKEPALAIFYGKQAVNLLQQVRGNIQGLDKEVQKSFLASKSDHYRDLASLLIDQGRLPEAQQVLDLLKQQEYTDYVRGNPAKMLSPLSLTPAEQQAEEDYQKLTAQLVTETERWNELKKKKARNPQEDNEFRQLSDALDSAGKGLDAYYSRLYKLFGEGNAANKEKAEVKGNVSVLNHLIENMPHDVALYTVVNQDRYSVIVITGSAMVAREYAITEKDLNQKVAAFQQVLRDPSRDPRPPAQELYKILVGPVKSDLAQARAKTLVWSLDGVLRYIPVAALYDGKHYLVETYNNVTFTPASIPYLSDHPDMNHASAAAMGISRRYEDDLGPLPAVEAELDHIVKDPQVPGANGILPGSILLNGQFTEKAMENELDRRHPIVHIASHFVFKPGDDNASYLLLAGKDNESSGYHLTVADFNANRNLGLDNTDLLTLSACETGISGNAGNGEEIEGLGAVAQNKGAKAVISSLWEVDDASTGMLMADFYKRWADLGGKVMKVEALRQAQLDLLHGKMTPNSGSSGRGISVIGNKAGKEAVPASYAHPYYWAPFVLTGNWR